MSNSTKKLLVCLLLALGSSEVFAVNACQACLFDKDSSPACQSSYFITDCKTAGKGGVARYMFKSATPWLSKCSDGTIMANTNCDAKTNQCTMHCETF
jgi:hypothetical protein